MTPAEFSALYQAEYATVINAAAFYGVPRDDREDVAQEVFARVWRHGQPVETREYLRTITRNLVIDRVRRLAVLMGDPARKGRGDIDVTLALHGVHDDADTHLDVEMRLARLTPQDRHIVRLLMAGYNGVEIGAALGVSKVTISRHFKHARAVMRGQRGCGYDSQGAPTQGRPMRKLAR